MKKTLMMQDGDSAVLSPGWYWFEMEFARPVTREVLMGALEAMGFFQVEIEQVDAVRVGAAGMTVRSGPGATVKAAANFVPIKTETKNVNVPIPVPAPAPPPRTVAQTQPGQAVVNATMPAGTSAVASPSALRPPTTPLGTSTSATSSPARTPQTTAPGAFQTSMPGGGTAPSAASSATPSAATEPGEYIPPNWRAQDEPQQAQEASYEQASAETREEVRAQVPVSKEAKARVKLPPEVEAAASRMKGSNRVRVSTDPPMFLYPGPPGPEHKVSGEAPVWRFRTLGFLGQAIQIASLPGMKWSLIHPIAFDPTLPISWRVSAYALAPGVTYDFRFLARDKNARSREDVVRLLESMGFAPVRVMMRKRNLRMPGRSGASLSEWMGIGRWTGPTSVVTSDDPLHFVEMKQTF